MFRTCFLGLEGRARDMDGPELRRGDDARIGAAIPVVNEREMCWPRAPEDPEASFAGSPPGCRCAAPVLLCRKRLCAWGVACARVWVGGWERRNGSRWDKRVSASSMALHPWHSNGGHTHTHPARTPVLAKADASCALSDSSSSSLDDSLLCSLRSSLTLSCTNPQRQGSRRGTRQPRDRRPRTNQRQEASRTASTGLPRLAWQASFHPSNSNKRRRT